jgi:hypothetical protein
MLTSADQFLCHLIGDYLLQSDWMAQVKVKKSTACLAHAFFYTLSFSFLTHSWKALLIIAGSHFIIDRWRLARYLCWAKNFLAPKWIEWGKPVETKEPNVIAGYANGASKVLEYGWVQPLVRNHPWAECVGTGYHKDRPLWLTCWLLFIADNTLHLICNGLALKYF